MQLWHRLCNRLQTLDVQILGVAMTYLLWRFVR